MFNIHCIQLVTKTCLLWADGENWKKRVAAVRSKPLPTMHLPVLTQQPYHLTIPLSTVDGRAELRQVNKACKVSFAYTSEIWQKVCLCCLKVSCFQAFNHIYLRPTHTYCRSTCIQCTTVTLFLDRFITVMCRPTELTKGIWPQKKMIFHTVKVTNRNFHFLSVLVKKKHYITQYSMLHSDVMN